MLDSNDRGCTLVSDNLVLWIAGFLDHPFRSDPLYEQIEVYQRLNLI